MEITRAFCMPNKSTFTIAPIREFLAKKMKPHETWADPYAGWASMAHITNDLNELAPTHYHLYALAFAQMLPRIDGVLFDPPYSPRQIKEMYDNIGIKVGSDETRGTFWSKVKDELAKKIVPGGKAICFGWNSMGFGINRGFIMDEILLVPHGGPHNDTIVTYERKRRWPKSP